jgi:enolase
MFTIKNIFSREILDSRGIPTVEADVILESGVMGRMMVPSGASTGKFEAWELRDGGERFGGKGVQKAVQNINTSIKYLLVGQDAAEQQKIDEMLIALDGTANKQRLGANAILAVSLAVAHAAANASGKSLYAYLGEKYFPAEKLSVPVPMVNIISGGLHAGKNIDLQDFLVIPVGATSYPHALEMVWNVYYKTKEVLNKKGYNANLVADEGGFGPALSSNKEALEILCSAFDACGYKHGEDMAIALDVASSHFYDAEKNTYVLQSENRSLLAEEMIDTFESWIKDYPVISIEDGLAEDDWAGWQLLTQTLGKKIQLIGDDLFTTNVLRIKKGIEISAGNAVLIKMNQIGTLTETVEAVKVAKSAEFKTIISARSGETEDSTLADLAVGLNGGQVKIGSITRSSRLSKYNQLLRINEQLNGNYSGGAFRF